MTHSTRMLDVIDGTFRWMDHVARGAHPYLDRWLTALVRNYALSWITAGEIIGSVRYTAPINPMRVYHVDPQQIERTVTWTRISTDRKADEHPRFRRPNYRLAARVFDGDWDRTDGRFTDSTIYQSFVAHFRDGIPWEETKFYEETLSAIENGATLWNCSSPSDLEQRCDRLDELYNQIATHGYMTQDELYTSGEPTARPHRFLRVLWDEIIVNVGRNGEFIFYDGRNRLAISRILELEEVPVAILVRHEKWQQKRDQIARGELRPSDLPEELRSHPDLIDLY